MGLVDVRVWARIWFSCLSVRVGIGGFGGIPSVTATKCLSDNHSNSNFTQANQVAADQNKIKLSG